MRRRLTAGVLLSCCACQAYTPISVTPATASQNVRVTLTDEGSRMSYASLGSGANQLEGKLGGVTDSTFSLSVTQVTRLTGVEEKWKGEDVTLMRRNVASVERQQTSVTRSVLLAGVLIGGAYLIGKSGGGVDQSGSVGGGGGPKTGQ